MKVWITKYALTSGIWTAEAVETRPGVIACIKPLTPSGEKQLHWGHFRGEGKDWHPTEEAAKARATEMRDKKIKSLRKQISKLENMEF